jgi:hypothetical protein
MASSSHIMGMQMKQNFKGHKNPFFPYLKEKLELSMNMLSDQAILKKIHSLPENLRGEILDFIDFVSKKHRKSNSKRVIPQYGSLKGTFKMSEDFDEPLEMFKDFRK